jgi:hypothetical protein
LPQDKLIVRFGEINLRGHEAVSMLRAAGFDKIA